MAVASFPSESEIEHADAVSVRGRFTLSRAIPDATPDEVFSTLTDEGSRRRWLRLPGRELSRSHDIRPGGEERVTSTMTIGERTEVVEHRSTFLAIDPPSRLQTAYVAVVDELPRWSSLVDLRLDPAEGGCLLTWSEAFLFARLSGDGGDDVAHLVGGARLRLNALLALLDERRAT